LVRIKSAAQIDAAYKASLGTVAPKYQAGIQATQGWKDSAIKGQALYEQRMQDQKVLARREKGLQQVSDEQWRAKAANVGASRIAQGMQASTDKRTRNYEPYRAAIEGISLPDRTGDAEQNVINRVVPIARTLRAVKDGQ